MGGRSAGSGADAAAADGVSAPAPPAPYPRLHRRIGGGVAAVDAAVGLLATASGLPVPGRAALAAHRASRTGHPASPLSCNEKKKRKTAVRTRS